MLYRSLTLCDGMSLALSKLSKSYDVEARERLAKTDFRCGLVLCKGMSLSHQFFIADRLAAGLCKKSMLQKRPQMRPNLVNSVSF